MAIRRVSTTTNGEESRGSASGALISADGRAVAFSSDAADLVEGDSNGRIDAFVKTLSDGRVELVSENALGQPSDADSPEYITFATAISAEGRYVAFTSSASNLVPGDTNGVPDAFRKDMLTGTIVRVSTAADGTEAEGYGINSSSISSGMTLDGRHVVFSSWATNLVEDISTGPRDLFVKDVQTGTVTRASVAPDGSEGNRDTWTGDISADGRLVAFSTWSSNLVAGDTNGVEDVFVKNLQTGTVTRVSTAADGTEADGDMIAGVAMSADGQWVVFSSSAGNLVPGDSNGVLDVLRKNVATGAIVRVSTAADGAQADAGSLDPAISDDGRWVAFRSAASNLVPGDFNAREDIFVKDLQTGSVTLVSLSDEGIQSDGGGTYGPSISADGRFVAFTSDATSLVPNDTNDTPDVFVVEVAAVPIRDEDDGIIGLATEADDRVLVGSASPGVTPPTGFTDGDDSLDGRVGHDTLIAGGGDDTLDGAFGDDSLASEAGDDVLLGGSETDSLDGGEGDDLIRGGTGDDRLIGGGGDDSLFGVVGRDFLDGGAGDDRLLGTAGFDTVFGGSGDDVLGVGYFASFAAGDDGDDFISVWRSGESTAAGGSGDDTIAVSWDRGTIIDAGSGDDSITAQYRSDATVFGGSGDDTFEGLNSLDGPNSVVGGLGDDSLFGAWGPDTLHGGADDDTLDGGESADRLFGDTGDDSLVGWGGDDALQGGDGDDTLLGWSGTDTLIGGDGDDELRDGSVRPMPGDDLFVGGLGADTIFNRRGDDTFRYERVADSLRDAPDAIGRFEGAGIAGGDRIDLSAIDADQTQAGDQAFVFLGDAQAFTAAGQVRMVDNGVNTLLLANVESGVTTAEFAIVLWDGLAIRAADYGAVDFVL